jgi:hypothetical protein
MDKRYIPYQNSNIRGRFFSISISSSRFLLDCSPPPTSAVIELAIRNAPRILSQDSFSNVRNNELAEILPTTDEPKGFRTFLVARRLVVDSLALKPDRPYNPTVHARWFGLGTLSRVGQLCSITGLSPSMVVFSNTFIYTCHTSLRLSSWAPGALLMTSWGIVSWFVSRRSPQETPYGCKPSNPRFGSATLLRPSCNQRCPLRCPNAGCPALR